MKQKNQSITNEFDEAQEKINSLQAELRLKRGEVDDLQGRFYDIRIYWFMTVGSQMMWHIKKGKMSR